MVRGACMNVLLIVHDRCCDERRLHWYTLFRTEGQIRLHQPRYILLSFSSSFFPLLLSPPSPPLFLSPPFSFVLFDTNIHADIMYSSQFPLPRVAQGSFRICLQALFKQFTGMIDPLLSSLSFLLPSLPLRHPLPLPLSKRNEVFALLRVLPSSPFISRILSLPSLHSLLSSLPSLLTN